MGYLMQKCLDETIQCMSDMVRQSLVKEKVAFERTKRTNMDIYNRITCAWCRGCVQGGSEVILLTHTHHRPFLLCDTVGRAGETLLLPGGHLVGARGTRWKKNTQKYSTLDMSKKFDSIIPPSFILTREIPLRAIY